MTLTAEQAHELNLAESWRVFKHSLAGKDLDRILDDAATAATRELLACEDEREMVWLFQRAKQRSGVLDFIRNYIAEQVALREELYAEMNREEE